ncbi:MAG: hypothetical protein IKN96_05515 [Oscillibacter sp.]|nr:hypothetical protein [Oscillibacter sp.]
MERKGGGGSGRGALPLVWLCFAAGAALGQALALGVPDAAPDLRRALDAYARRGGVVDAPLALSTLAEWLRVPALTFLWGFTSLGAPLVCLTAAAFGFLLSFSAGCFAGAFGRRGVVLSAAAMGLRVLVALPCFFFLALSSMERAAWLRRGAPPDGRPNRRARVTLCALVLLSGAALDLCATPRLLRLALGWLRTGFP